MNHIDPLGSDIADYCRKGPESVRPIKFLERGKEKRRSFPKKLFVKNTPFLGGTDIRPDSEGRGMLGKLRYVTLASPGTKIVDKVENGDHGFSEERDDFTERDFVRRLR